MSYDIQMFRDKCGIFNRWLYLSIRGESLLSHEKLNDKRIALYGLGDIGKRLVEEMESRNIVPVYIVDRNAESCFLDIPMYRPDEKLPTADVIIVTIFYEYSEIRENLRTIFNGEILSIKEIVDDLWINSIDSRVALMNRRYI